MRSLLLLSTSTLHGTGYMEYAVPWIEGFLGHTRSILFVPWARPSGISHERYTEMFRERMEGAGYAVTGIHEHESPGEAIEEASSVFVGGGNTFVLLREVWASGIVECLRARVAAGMPYMGSSAGSNLAGLSIGTTNDMPIVHPPTFEALGLVPFNINPHYLDPDPGSTHMGETRETRIGEFHHFNEQPVLGMREGAMLRVKGDSATLEGRHGGRLFRAGEDPVEVGPGESLDFLL